MGYQCHRNAWLPRIDRVGRARERLPTDPVRAHLAAGRVSHRARPAFLPSRARRHHLGIAARGIAALRHRHGGRSARHPAIVRTLRALGPADSGRSHPSGELVRPLRPGCRLHRSTRPGSAVTGIDPRRLPPHATRPVPAPDRFRERALERRACLIGLGSRRKLAPDRGICRLASVPRHRRRGRSSSSASSGNASGVR